MARLSRFQSFRTRVQCAFALLTNTYAAGFARGTIYQGPLKAVCVPGLNCYSCPGALGACPIGSLQAALNSFELKLPLYVTGFLCAFGALLGRFVCGWLCPFGFFQELLHKIPGVKKVRSFRGDAALRRLKYAVLAVAVVLLPLFARDSLGLADPWFCKYLCPAGTLMGGWTLAALNDGLRAALGWLFAWKSAVLVVIILCSAVIYRPFCKYLCPLGALYGFFNSIAAYRLRVDAARCISCGACTRACPMGAPIPSAPDSAECIRCGICRAVCPADAISTGFRKASDA